MERRKKYQDHSPLLTTAPKSAFSFMNNFTVRMVRAVNFYIASSTKSKQKGF